METSNKIDDYIKRMSSSDKLEEVAHLKIKLASWDVPEKELAKMGLKELLEL